MAAISQATSFNFGHRRSIYLEAKSHLDQFTFPAKDLELYDDFDLIYRTLCGILFNFGPTSGHPGGSISSGRIVEALIFHTMDYDFKDPEAQPNDLLSYAAGHKAMGLYAMWALRNECARASQPDLLPGEEHQLRLEDLLGFRKNPTQGTPLFKSFNAKPLDGHPTPQTPFIKLATGASGVGVPASFGLAFGTMDAYREDAPIVHVLEGEGGMTAGRVSEALATAATAQLWNLRLHLDWNQSSIDSDRVCREGEQPGDYVQWNPSEMCYLHDWNVIYVEDGSDILQVLAAQELSKQPLNNQPTAVIYRTTKGWQYGIEGRKSHGAGHSFCSDEYFEMLGPLEERFGIEFPRMQGEKDPVKIEQYNYDTLLTIRSILEKNREISDYFAGQLVQASERLGQLDRTRPDPGPNLEPIYTDRIQPHQVPPDLQYPPGSSMTLRAALGNALDVLNHETRGAIIGASADLLNSTSISNLGRSSSPGLYNAVSNPDARLIATGGICEDCMGAFMAGVASFGVHIGAGSSYAAFIASLQHIPARLHGIGQQARNTSLGTPYNTFLIVCAHAGLKTGEDGATHADPQALQLMLGNFPDKVLITLTPWEPSELWPLTVAGLKARPAVLVPFVTRPTEVIPDRAALKFPPADATIKGLYAFRKADPQMGAHHGTVVLQGSEVATDFVNQVLPRIDENGLNMNVFYVSSAELFSALPADEQLSIYPHELAEEAMGITGFTLPTMYRWITSEEGRQRTLHAFQHGHYLGSGQAHKVLEEAGLNGDAQWEAVKAYAEWMEAAKR